MFEIDNRRRELELRHTVSEGSLQNVDWERILDTGLFQDVDLAEALTRLRTNPDYWTMDDDDLLALSHIREKFGRGRKPSDDRQLGFEDDEEDAFDDGVTRLYPPTPEATGVLVNPDEPDVEVRILTRPRWQVKYIMAKAKLMLVEEENRMRRGQLLELLEMEAALKNQVAL